MDSKKASCKHHFYVMRDINDLYCRHCCKTKNEIELEELIQQQDKMLELAINAAARLGCPPYEHEPCPEMATEVSCADCWRKYLQGEVGK